MPLRRPAHAVRVELEIPFHDCDPLFVAWHGRYLEYLEAGRQALLRSRRLDVPDLIALRHRLYVADVRCRYNFPLTYGDRVEVTAWFGEHERLIKVLYDVFNRTKGRRSARASTLLAVTDDRGTFLPEIPEPIRTRLPELSS
ncbi:MAG: acyl-CoA thioesterase [Myxococcales bacterium]|nr:acyl-CoA thioesterase [Myxococcales bacterium]